ncbi:MAG: FG-GAP-like repeat-containing protein [candidate division KSB1 bacterium]|nr:FG-GAP-like repeat-containing protein [candidate division KSB1 bacterium]MDZ7273121.1 FG-GAP-like repeat-containing protein [candidate division KSB1 bacterium]MDZ7285223.1 FG-GAP-like repeat-containing protein [candidate division KSB1 bacterium]MDZ7298255.1 FG-GAP-like repeat-containing protein [candidate division KSB1 bacterium]MDZ7308270.1 FG-GAP-like repeat-containing protein [candidate division KSB1 bacterium]
MRRSDSRPSLASRGICLFPSRRPRPGTLPVRAGAALLLLLSFTAVATAQLRVLAVSPSADDLHAGSNTSVRVTFDQALDETALPPRPLRVWGSFRGEYAGTLSYDAFANQLAFTPFQSFIEGEEVTVVLRRPLRGRSGSTLTQPLLWRFRVATPLGSARFVPAVIDLGAGRSQEPTQILPADFDNDGFIDLAVVHRGSNHLTLLQNVFQKTAGAALVAVIGTLATHNTPASAAAADFNSDGRLDLAVANFNSNTVQVFIGDGAFGFSTPRVFDTGEHPGDLIAQDFDGDGDLDLALTLPGSDRLALLRNDSLGFFSESQRLAVGATPNKITAWDFDGDHDLDLAVANSGSRSLTIFRNDASGVFSTAGTVALTLTPVDLQTGDIAGRTANKVGDGRRELVVLTSDLPFLGKPSGAPAAGSSAVTVFRWEAGSSTFAVVQNLPLTGRMQSFILCDVDSLDESTPASPYQPDRDLDLIFTRFWDDGVAWLRNADNAPLNPAAVAGLDSVHSAKALAYFDCDRDGDNDFVVSNYLDNQLVIYRNGGQRATPCGLVDSLGTPVTTIDFGAVPVGGSGLATYFLANPTSLDFLFTTTLSDSEHFRLLPARGSLPAGEIVPIRLEFAPRDTLPYTALLLLKLNDYLNASESCAIVLQGRGVRPLLHLSQTEIDFGCVPPGATAIRELILENRGNYPLEILGAATTTNYFLALTNLSGLRLPPNAAVRVSLAFRPDRLGPFRDSLRIRTSDPVQPLVSVSLRGCGSASAPVITSPDTLRAIEDVEALYVATASDPDGSQPAFRFLNLPRWLSARGDTVRGTPREGDGNTSFTLIASDGFFADTLAVIVLVTPVNDAPVFDSLAAFVVFEEELLTFTVSARDPEGAAVTLSATSLPPGSLFTEQGSGRGIFTWRPPFGSAGSYRAIFAATEQTPAGPLTASLTVSIDVIKRLPDLHVRTLNHDPATIKRNQSVTVTAVFGDSLAPVTETFRAALFRDNTLFADTTLSGLQRGGTFRFTRTVSFDEVGRHTLDARIDIDNRIPEINEANNVLRLEVMVEAGALAVAPNPFTPNADGYNDEVIFDLRDFAGAELELRIFGLRGELLRSFRVSGGSTCRWNGANESGEQQYPGPYLYLLTERGRKVASGYVVLAR